MAGSRSSALSAGYISKYLIARLKYKCSITLISLLEARKDNDIVQRMMKSLNSDVIKRNIIDIYYLYEEIQLKQYNSEMFLHFNEPITEEEAENDAKKLEKASFIIETGFNLFIVFCNFMEVNKNKSNDEIMKSKSEGEDDQSWIEKMKNNIIGKILQLPFSIIQSIKDTGEEYTRKLKLAMLGKEDISWQEKIMKLKENRQKLKNQAMNFFQKNTLHIEVQREDQLIEKAYFYCPPFCKALDKETKTNFQRNVKRVSAKAKVTSLMEESKELIKKMKHNYWLSSQLNKIKTITVLVQNIPLLRDVAFIMAIAINIMILVSYSRNSQGESENNRKRPVLLVPACTSCLCSPPPALHFVPTLTSACTNLSDTSKQITILGVIVIVLSSFIVSYFLAKTAPLLIAKAWTGAVSCMHFSFFASPPPGSSPRPAFASATVLASRGCI